jgi:hypothetical protein
MNTAPNMSATDTSMMKPGTSAAFGVLKHVDAR